MSDHGWRPRRVVTAGQLPARAVPRHGPFLHALPFWSAAEEEQEDQAPERPSAEGIRPPERRSSQDLYRARLDESHRCEEAGRDCLTVTELGGWIERSRVGNELPDYEFTATATIEVRPKTTARPFGSYIGRLVHDLDAVPILAWTRNPPLPEWELGPGSRGLWRNPQTHEVTPGRG
ncbi:hypothetical protein CDD83_1583 [Cordyceps sp. RAO-2017]|nr:hypothetical protein CDD83_1583 [Cordyceps sp. RAO-2017]